MQLKKDVEILQRAGKMIDIIQSRLNYSYQYQTSIDDHNYFLIVFLEESRPVAGIRYDLNDIEEDELFTSQFLINDIEDALLDRIYIDEDYNHNSNLSMLIYWYYAR